MYRYRQSFLVQKDCDLSNLIKFYHFRLNTGTGRFGGLRRITLDRASFHDAASGLQGTVTVFFKF